MWGGTKPVHHLQLQDGSIEGAPTLIEPVLQTTQYFHSYFQAPKQKYLPVSYTPQWHIQPLACNFDEA
jgi:hypothetical protein